MTDMNTQCVNPEANKLPRAVACPRFMWVESGVYKLLGVEHSAVYKQCPKRIYFDLGVNAFQSSIEWAITKYPVLFDEVHGWEMSPRLFPRIPPADVFRRAHPGRQLPSLVMIYNAAADAVSDSCTRANCPNKAHAARSYCATPATCQRKRELLSKYGCCSRCHIAKYLLDGFAREDFILFRIDIEGVEYKVFDDMVRMGAQYLVNEVMAELHFKTDTPGLVGWSAPGRTCVAVIPTQVTPLHMRRRIATSKFGEPIPRPFTFGHEDSKHILSRLSPLLSSTTWTTQRWGTRWPSRPCVRPLIRPKSQSEANLNCGPPVRVIRAVPACGDRDWRASQLLQSRKRAQTPGISGFQGVRVLNTQCKNSPNNHH